MIDPVLIDPALALIELSTVTLGIRVGDAMVKRSEFDFLRAGTVQPGRYLILVGGSVAAVEEGLTAAKQEADGSLLDLLFLPAVDRSVVQALVGRRESQSFDALGVIETKTVAATLAAADAAVKGAMVTLLEVHLADGLGGKGYCLLGGRVSNVEAAVEIASNASNVVAQLVGATTISQLHSEMWTELQAGPLFAKRLGREFP